MRAPMNEYHSFSRQYGLVKSGNELYSVVMQHTHESPAQRKKSSAILDAARKHFAIHGFEATKLAAVAQDAGVAVGTIYLRYNSKAELLDGVLNEVDEAFSGAMDASRLWETPFPERFSLLVKATFETAHQQDHLAELMALSSFGATTSKAKTKPMMLKIEEHIRDGIARRELRADIDPQLVAFMAHGMVDGAMRAASSGTSRDPDEIVTAIADAYARWLGRA